MVLENIIEQKRRELRELQFRFPLKKLQKALETNIVRRRDFKKAVSQHDNVNIIAELKHASPSEGIIVENFNPLTTAQHYEFANACAISVLTESHFFKGRLSYLRTVRDVTARPILRKDFIVDIYQIYESALHSADAVLLIASLLNEKQISSFIGILREYEIDAVVEVHTADEVKKALDAGADILGINNRDLKTFTVDLSTSEALRPLIPQSKIVIAESGIKTNADIQRLQAIGINAFLVGTTLLRSNDVIKKLQELRGAEDND